MTVNTEAIYRAMGWRQSRWDARHWHDPAVSDTTKAYSLPDPLADWSAFGEILEWAEQWADGIERRIQITRTWEWDGTTNARQWLVLVTKGPDIVARAQSPDFRTAVLAALESAIGGEQ